MRPQPLLRLLNSVKKQTLYPNEILIIDGSVNEETKKALGASSFKNLKYFSVDNANRGLTKQRNFGVKKVSDSIKVICFLDDDTILEANYFGQLIQTFKIKEDIVAVGGYITNDTNWYKKPEHINFDEFIIDGLVRKLGRRYLFRKKLGLLPDELPGLMPSFSNGFPVSLLPPTNKTYEVEFFTGCAMSFKKSLFDTINFSTYFEGYGLYEDLDFCLRASKYGKSYVNTAAKLEHYHDKSGRPNKYKYGKMVVRNGWYVWRVKYPKPSFRARLQWNAILFLLTLIRLSNVTNTKERKEAFTESLGRIVGWFSLINKPTVER